MQNWFQNLILKTLILRAKIVRFLLGHAVETIKGQNTPSLSSHICPNHKIKAVFKFKAEKHEVLSTPHNHDNTGINCSNI